MGSFSKVADTGCYQFKIDHSKTKDMGIGKCITSPKFQVGQHDWAIYYFPRGILKEERGKYVSVILVKLEKSVKVRATLEVALLGKHGTLPSIAMKEISYKFRVLNFNIGYPYFFERAKLEEKYVKEYYFVLFVKITVIDESCAGAHWNTNSIGFPCERLQKFREENKRTDVSFNIDDKIFVAHRLILATHSPVFEADLFGSMAESNMETITISEMMPSVFKAMLDFMYNGSLSVNEKLVDCEGRMSSTAFLQHLLAAADRYAVKKLKAICEYELIESISLDNVLSTLELAEKHKCIDLKKECLQFVVDKDNFVSLVLTEGYLQLMLNYPFLFAELKNLAGKCNLGKF